LSCRRSLSCTEETKPPRRTGIVCEIRIDPVISRYAAATTTANRREDDRIISRYAAATTAAKRREMTLEIPSLPIEIPYRESAASMVRF